MTYVDIDGNELSDYQLVDMFDEFLWETRGPVVIMGLEYEPGPTLREVDPLAYNEYFSDWLDAEIGENIFEQEVDEARGEDYLIDGLHR